MVGFARKPMMSKQMGTWSVVFGQKMSYDQSSVISSSPNCLAKPMHIATDTKYQVSIIRYPASI